MKHEWFTYLGSKLHRPNSVKLPNKHHFQLKIWSINSILNYIENYIETKQSDWNSISNKEENQYMCAVHNTWKQQCSFHITSNKRFEYIQIKTQIHQTSIAHTNTYTCTLHTLTSQTHRLAADRQCDSIRLCAGE